MAALSAKGTTELTVAPVFFGQGGRLRNYFLVLLEECRGKFPKIQLSASPTVSEDLTILQRLLSLVQEKIENRQIGL